MQDIIEYEKEAQSRITRNIRYLLAATHTDQATLAANLGRTPGSISKKLKNEQKWTPGELFAIADIFHISPLGLLDDPKSFMRQVTQNDEFIDLAMRETRCSSAQVAA